MSLSIVIRLALALQLASAVTVSHKASRMVRKATVNADGSLVSTRSKLSGAALALENLTAVESGKMGSKLQELASRFEEIARSGESIDKDTINTIKGIVVDTLLPGLAEARAVATKRVATNLDQIKLCNTHENDRITEIKNTTEKVVETNRVNHTECREVEKSKVSDKDSKCTSLDNYLDGVNEHAVLPADRVRAEMVVYCEKMDTYFCPKGNKVKTLDEVCTAADTAHTETKEKCDKLQRTFETAFCTWRAETKDACASGSNCHENALKVYQDHVDATKILVEKWKLELSSLKKILCYLDILLEDSAEKGEDKFSVCDSSKIDSSELDIDYGTPVAKVTCDQSSVDKYPGADGFSMAEYSKLADYTATIVPCLE